MVRVKQLGHVVLRVSDLPKSEKFYADILGLEVTTRRPSGMMVFLSARDNTSHELALIAAEDAPKDDRDKGIGLVHFAWEAANMEDLQEIYKNCIASGVDIHGIADHGVSLGFYFADPDGHELELFYELKKEEWPKEGYLFAGKFPGSLEGQEGEKLTDARLKTTF